MLCEFDLVSYEWSELESAINVHMESIFFGSLPKTPKDFYKRYGLRIGVPLSACASGVRGAQSMGKKCPCLKPSRLDAACLTTTKGLQVLSKYFKGKETMIRTAHALDAVIGKAQKNQVQSEDSSEAEAQDIPSVLLLKRLRAGIPSILHTASFDYISLTKDPRQATGKHAQLEEYQRVLLLCRCYSCIITRLLSEAEDMTKDRTGGWIFEGSRKDLKVAAAFVNTFLSVKNHTEATAAPRGASTENMSGTVE